MKKEYRVVCACALAITVFAAGLAGCAGGSTSSAAAESGGSGESSSGTTYVGKVTAITGNQVELALGTVQGGGSGQTHSGREQNASGSRPQPSGSRPERKADTGSGDASGAMQPPAASGDTSGTTQPPEGGKTGDREGSITLTGETKTVLIPVGLILSGVGTGGEAQGGNGASGGGMPAQGGNGRTGAEMPAQGGGAPAQGNQAAPGNAQKSNSQSAQKASSGKDYSSITVGMILQITETAGADGTQTISAVRVLSTS